MPGPDIYTLLERIHELEVKMARFSVITAIATAVTVSACQAVVTQLLT